MPSVLIHYFSGTGNTYRATLIVERRLKSAGYGVQWSRVGNDRRSPAGRFDVHVFAFPVYACDVPDVMLRYLRRLPRGDHARAAVIAIDGSLSADSRIPGAQGDPGLSCDHAQLILTLKGYDVFFTDAAPYPAGITELIPAPGLEEQGRIRKLADERVEGFAERIATGKRSIKHNLWLAILYWPFGCLYNLFGRRFFGKLYVADGKCVSCGTCAKVCPADTITLIGGKPRWGWNCEGCQRCINACPKSAIQGSFPRLSVFIMLSLLPYADWASLALSAFGFIRPDGAYGIVFESIAYTLGFLVAFIVLDMIFVLLERTPIVRRLMDMNFTYTYGRYKDPGFSPLEKDR